MPQQTARPLKIGLWVPTMEGAMDGGTARWSDLRSMALHAEATGFDSIWVNDHLLHEFGGPDEPQRGIWEGWSLLSSLAAVTARVELGTMVICTSFRNPALLAKMADTVEEISGGRLILGLGAGNHEPDFRAFGYPFDHLVGRFEEALEIIHTLLRKGTCDFHGTYYETQACELRPRGPRIGGPPIMIGARANRPRSLRLTAKYADYWTMFMINKIETLVPLRGAVDVACVKAGRDPATLQRTVTIAIDLPGFERDQNLNWVQRFRAMAGPPATGTPEQLAELLRSFAHAGVSHVQLWLEPNTLAGIDAFVPILELLDRG